MGRSSGWGKADDGAWPGGDKAPPPEHANQIAFKFLSWTYAHFLSAASPEISCFKMARFKMDECNNTHWSTRPILERMT